MQTLAEAQGWPPDVTLLAGLQRQVDVITVNCYCRMTATLVPFLPEPVARAHCCFDHDQSCRLNHERGLRSVCPSDHDAECQVT